MNAEEKYNEVVTRFRENMHKELDEAITDIHCGLAPHFEDDRIYNVRTKVDQVVESMVAGDFTRVDDNTVCVKDLDGIGVNIRITTNRYDRIRDNLIKALPACPKDAKIKSLEDIIEMMQRHRH